MAVSWLICIVRASICACVFSCALLTAVFCGTEVCGTEVCDFSSSESVSTISLLLSSLFSLFLLLLLLASSNFFLGAFGVVPLLVARLRGVVGTGLVLLLLLI